MKEYLVGAFSDTSLLAIGRYLMKLELFYNERGNNINLNGEIDFLLGKYNFVKKNREEGFKADVLNAYKFVKEKQTTSISAVEFAKFVLDSKNGNLSPEKLEQDLIMELNFC